MGRYVFTLTDPTGSLVLYDESEPKESYLDFWQRCSERTHEVRLTKALEVMKRTAEKSKTRAFLQTKLTGYLFVIEDLYLGEVVKRNEL